MRTDRPTPLGTDLPRSDAESPVPVAGDVLDAAGKSVGGLLLFLEDELLSSLEVYSEADVDPLPLPRADRVRFFAPAHTSDRRLSPADSPRSSGFITRPGAGYAVKPP